jgi:hypothetical protein
MASTMPATSEIVLGCQRMPSFLQSQPAIADVLMPMDHTRNMLMQRQRCSLTPLTRKMMNDERERSASGRLFYGALLVARGRRPIIIGDRWDACAPFLARRGCVPARCLVRVTSHRVFSHPAPARVAGQRGASRTDGDRFPCHEEKTHGEPDAAWEGIDARGARIQVRCWTHLHLCTVRDSEVSLIHIIRQGATGSARDPTVNWCVWKGGAG